MTRADLARSLRRETGCSRATAYCSMADALAEEGLNRAIAYRDRVDELVTILHDSDEGEQPARGNREQALT
jgi:hypothetical protein